MGIFGRPNIEKLWASKNVNGLIEALKDKNSHVRKAAAEALGEIGDEKAVEHLIEALKDKNSHVRKAATKALALVSLGGLSSGNHKQCLLFEIVHEGASDISQEDKYPAWYSSNYTRTTKWAKIRRSFSWSIIRPEIGEETFSRKCLCCEQILKINVPSLALIASRERKTRKLNRILRIIGLICLLFAVSAFLTLGFGWLPSSRQQVLIFCGAMGIAVSLMFFGAGSGVNVSGHQLIYGLSNPPRGPGPFNGHYIELFKELP